MTGRRSASSASPCSTRPTISPARRRIRSASSSRSSNSGVELVFDEGVPTETSNYTVLLNNIRASNPDAVLHLGYASNDIAFLRNVQDNGIKFKFLFCLYPGIETELLEKNLGTKPLSYVFTYVTSLDITYQAEFGMSLKEYSDAWHKKYADTHVEFGFNSIAGYTTGLVLEKALADRRQSRSARLAQGDLQPVGQAQDAGRHLRARRRRRTDRRAHADRAIPARRRRPSEAGDGVAARRSRTASRSIRVRDRPALMTRRGRRRRRPVAAECAECSPTVCSPVCCSVCTSP